MPKVAKKQRVTQALFRDLSRGILLSRELWKRRRILCAFFAIKVKRQLGASWAGPLWRRSTAWLRHFAAVSNGRLHFWYSAKHALDGVSPVLIVQLTDAQVVQPSSPDDLPVLTLHAALADKPNQRREWLPWH